jgi:hypothetical protein
LSAAADKPDLSWPNPADSAKNCLFRKIQRSPRPGLKQKASQYPVFQYPASQNLDRNLPAPSNPLASATATLMEK